MILYKYLNRAAGLAMLKEARIGFSQVKSFNDPTEISAAAYAGELDGPFYGIPREVIFQNVYAVCSLTRAPLNAIMWAHYGDKHKGLVVGIDTKLAGIEDVENCVLPTTFGSVIYTASKPQHQYYGSEDFHFNRDNSNKFDPNYLEAMQRVFLHKSSEWAYEEEVRAIKTIDGLNRDDSIILNEDTAIAGELTYLLKIPLEALVSVHVGWRSIGLDHDAEEDLFLKIEAAVPRAKISFCQFKPGTWNMEDHYLKDWRQSLEQIYGY